jgi:hypothetical protein
MLHAEQGVVGEVERGQVQLELVDTFIINTLTIHIQDELLAFQSNFLTKLNEISGTFQGKYESILPELINL